MPLPTNQTGQQNLYVASASGRPMGARRQTYSEVINYSVDYSNWLSPGDSLATVVSAVSSSAAQQMVVSSLVINATLTGVTFQLSGGIAGYKYEIELVASTSTGQAKVDIFYVTVLPLIVQTTQTLPLPLANVFMSQFKRALAQGYAPLNIPALSVLKVQLLVNSDPGSDDNIQWFSGLYISSGDPVWKLTRDAFSLSDAQIDQFLLFSSKLAP